MSPSRGENKNQLKPTPSQCKFQDMPAKKKKQHLHFLGAFFCSRTKVLSNSGPGGFLKKQQEFPGSLNGGIKTTYQWLFLVPLIGGIGSPPEGNI